MNDRADRRRRAYLDSVFERMHRGDRAVIAAKALAVVDLWERNGVHPRYPAAWRRLLEGDLDHMRSAILASTPEASELRHCMPFAGVLSNSERRALRERFA